MSIAAGELLSMWSELELCGLGGAREGNHVADVLHTSHKEDETLETETETTMWASSVLTSVKVPVINVTLHTAAFNLFNQLLVAFFTN